MVTVFFWVYFHGLFALVLPEALVEHTLPGLSFCFSLLLKNVLVFAFPVKIDSFWFVHHSYVSVHRSLVSSRIWRSSVHLFSCSCPCLNCIENNVIEHDLKHYRFFCDIYCQLNADLKVKKYLLAAFIFGWISLQLLFVEFISPPNVSSLSKFILFTLSSQENFRLFFEKSKFDFFFCHLVFTTVVRVHWVIPLCRPAMRSLAHIWRKNV